MSNWYGAYTLLRKECSRFIRIWPQTLVPPLITTVLYFAIFGKLIGGRIGPLHGIDYAHFIAPGLIIMTLITNAYANVSSSFFSMKFQRNIEEIMVAPFAAWQVILSFTVAGTLRGVITAILVTLVSRLFVDLHVHDWFILTSVAVLTAILFSLAGLINGIYARKFDDVSIVPSFILSPLTYLGGVFYSTSMLPGKWAEVSHYNPLFHIISAFRYGMVGYDESAVGISVICIFVICVILAGLANYLVSDGGGISITR